MIKEESYHTGRGSQVNPVSKYRTNSISTNELDGLDEELELLHSTQILFENAREIVNKINSPDLMGWSMNPYQGCEHGCIYCYARNTHQYWGFSAGLDFEQKIIVKQNAAELLEKTFRSKSWQPEPIMFSGNTDCYQPVERKLRLTRQMLEVALKYRNPVSMITKNQLILRDIDILGELASMNLAHVMVSITTLDEDLRLKMEPRTATAHNRLKVIQKLSAAGIPVGVMTAPIIPGLNSHEIPELIKAASEHGATSAGYTIVRLNDAVAEIFTDWIRKNYPDRADKVLSQISEAHGGKLSDSRFGVRMRGEGKMAEMIKTMHRQSKKKYFKKSNFEFDLSLFRRKPEQPELF